ISLHQPSLGCWCCRRLWAAVWAVGQVRYSVPEEAEAGTVVGRLWQDLGLGGEAKDGGAAACVWCSRGPAGRVVR
uniref:Cadherin N-terminal domain-containing protein n=1 Tax=Coturnix japonica TaxID=93934 RepID=A0A8C2TJN7_COTJA